MMGEVCIPAVAAHPQQSPNMNKAILHLGCPVISAAAKQIVLEEGQSTAIQRKRQRVQRKTLIAFSSTWRAFVF